MGWLSGWSYRKSHVINSASGAGTNYQVKIIAHYGSGTDYNDNTKYPPEGHIYLNSHCRTDFGDVRFTDDDGETVLDYWMESKTVNSSVTEYENNPVYAVSGHACKDPSIWKDGSTYYMAISYDPEADNPADKKIRILKSTDMISWTYLYDISPAADENGIAAPFLWKEGNTWYLFYQDLQTNWKIKRMQSTDIENSSSWTNRTTVLEKSESGWDSYHVYDAFIIKVGSTYYLFYTGQATATGTRQIGYATSDSITGTFTKYSGNPVITAASGGGYEAEEIYYINGMYVLICTQVASNQIAVWFTATSFPNSWEYQGIFLNVTSGTWKSLHTGSQGGYVDENNVLQFMYQGDDGVNNWRIGKASATFELGAVFWVEVADDLSSNSATIYVYYGKSDATTTSNGANTFLFFDDFESYTDGSDINGQGGWVTKRVGGVGEAKVRLVNGRKHLHIKSTNYQTAVVHQFSAQNNMAIHTYKYADDWDEAYDMGFGDGGYSTYGLVNGYWAVWCGWAGAYSKIVKYVSSTEYPLASISDSDQNNVYHKCGFGWYGSGLKAWKDGSLKLSATDTTFSSQTYLHLHCYSGSSHYIDWVFIRKYVDPEPSHSSWGSEEQAGGGQTYEIYVDALSQSLATPAYQSAYTIDKEASVAAHGLTTSETMFNISKDAFVNALADMLVEVVTGVIEIFKDAIATAQVLCQTETAFNIDQDALAQALTQTLFELSIAKDAVVKASTTSVYEVTFTLPLGAMVKAEALSTLESTFNISPEATIKVLAEVSIIKPTEVKITRLYLVIGDLAIQIQGN